MTFRSGIIEQQVGFSQNIQYALLKLIISAKAFDLFYFFPDLKAGAISFYIVL